MNDAMDPNDPGSLEVAHRLEAYADLRLTPSLSATSRMRTNVMNAAHRRSALIAADARRIPTDVSASIPARRSAWALLAGRRLAAALAVSCLALGILAGSSFAASPGGPLYEARLWAETANLPASGVARAQAQVTRLQRRVEEAQRAATAGDGSAARAALSAYSRIVIDAGHTSAGDPSASATIEAGVHSHVAILAAMVEAVPTPAQGAMDQALSSSATVLDEIEQPGTPVGGNGSGSGNGPGNSSSPGTGAAASPSLDPGASDDPGSSPSPGNGEAASPSPDPGASDDPGSSPSPGNGNNASPPVDPGGANPKASDHPGSSPSPGNSDDPGPPSDPGASANPGSSPSPPAGDDVSPPPDPEASTGAETPGAQPDGSPGPGNGNGANGSGPGNGNGANGSGPGNSGGGPSDDPGKP